MAEFDLASQMFLSQNNVLHLEIQYVFIIIGYQSEIYNQAIIYYMLTMYIMTIY